MTDYELINKVADKYNVASLFIWAADRVNKIKEGLIAIAATTDDIPENDRFLYNINEAITCATVAAHNANAVRVHMVGNASDVKKIEVVPQSNRNADNLRGFIDDKIYICDIVSGIVSNFRITKSDKMTDYHKNVKSFFIEMDNLEERIYDVI